jgi:diguanylate cyclase (GGDEF)-like protein
MAIADIDHFKLVNDTFGHQVGDAVLKHLAEFMHNSLRSTDYVARWGGEEFTILLPETNLDDAEELLNRLRVGVSNHVIPEIGRAVTLSFGVTAGTKSDSPEDLLKRADRALYTSKQTGRNKVIKLRRSAADSHSAPVPL